MYMQNECKLHWGRENSAFRSLQLVSNGNVTVQFAATACTIVSGALAERAKFEAYILYSFFMAAWVSSCFVSLDCQMAAATTAWN